MSREQFYCEPCNVSWYDDCTFWNGYLSSCPQCGENREAIINTDFSFTDPRMMDGPVFDLAERAGEDQAAERSEGDLEAERDIIHDEIAEALGSVGAVGGADADEDGDSEGEGGDAAK